VALQEQRRPLLAPSRLEDPNQKLMFMEGHWLNAQGGRAAAERIENAAYFAISLRNVGSGIAVCQGWVVRPELSLNYPTHAPLEDFHLQSRDLYVPAGDIGMWQGALRNPDDPVRTQVIDVIDAGHPFTVELLYSDHVGLQRTISRFGLTPVDGSWLVSLNRHWYLDWEGPRPESVVLAAVESIRNDQEAVAERNAADMGHASTDTLGTGHAHDSDSPLEEDD
jgi:hypothetical protein